MKGKVVFCDTNFLIDAIDPSSNHHKIKQKLLDMGCGFAFNTTVHSELIHFVRFEMIEHAVEHSYKNLPPRMRRIWDRYEKGTIGLAEFVKKIVREDLKFIKTVLGPDGSLLKAEVDRFLVGCTYFGTKQAVSASWADVYQIAGQTGLDSSDAMIFNLVAHNATFEGLITSDSDFAHVKGYKAPRNFFVWIIKD